MTSSHETLSTKPPCIFVPWVAPIACPKPVLAQVCVLDLHLPTSFACAEVPVFSPLQPLPLNAEMVRQYLQQIQSLSEDHQALSANMFTHLISSQTSMSRAEQRELTRFTEVNTKTREQETVSATNHCRETAHCALLCAALAQSQQLEMAALIEKYHATLEQFTVSLHGAEHGEAEGKMQTTEEFTHPLHRGLHIFDTNPEPIQWRTILDRIALFVPENTLFVLDAQVLQDLPDVLLQPLDPALFERLPSEWSPFHATIRGALCTLRHVLDTATKIVCSDKKLDCEHVFIIYPITQN